MHLWFDPNGFRILFRLVRIYRQIAAAVEATKYFQRTEFNFNSNNLWLLQAMVHPEDMEDFNMVHSSLLASFMTISKDQLIGVAKYALKEKMDTEEDIRGYCRQIKR